MTLQAITSFAVGVRMIDQGSLVADDDPIVLGRAHLFRKVDVPTADEIEDIEEAEVEERDGVEVIETATARPGEVRNVPPAKMPRKADDIIAWIGDNPERAQQALDAELANRSPRTTVIGAANAVLNPEGE